MRRTIVVSVCALLLVGSPLAIRPAVATLPGGGTFNGSAFYDARNGCRMTFGGQVKGRIQTGTKTWTVLGGSAASSETTCPRNAGVEPFYGTIEWGVKTPDGLRRLYCTGIDRIIAPAVTADMPLGSPRSMTFRTSCKTIGSAAPPFTMVLNLEQTGEVVSDDGVFTHYRVVGTFASVPVAP